MSKKPKCPLTISDWLQYLNARQTERVQLVTAKKSFQANQSIIFISIVTICFVGITSAINVLRLNGAVSAILIGVTVILYILLILSQFRRLDGDFEEFYNETTKHLILVDTIIRKIMDNELKTSEEVRDEWIGALKVDLL